MSNNTPYVKQSEKPATAEILELARALFEFRKALYKDVPQDFHHYIDNVAKQLQYAEAQLNGTNDPED